MQESQVIKNADWHEIGCRYFQFQELPKHCSAIFFPLGLFGRCFLWFCLFLFLFLLLFLFGRLLFFGSFWPFATILYGRPIWRTCWTFGTFRLVINIDCFLRAGNVQVMVQRKSLFNHCPIDDWTGIKIQQIVTHLFGKFSSGNVQGSHNTTDVHREAEEGFDEFGKKRIQKRYEHACVDVHANALCEETKPAAFWRVPEKKMNISEQLITSDLFRIPNTKTNTCMEKT